MDEFSAFFIGMGVGAVIGVFIMAVILAIGQLREKEICNIDSDNGIMFIDNKYDIEQVDEHKYIIKIRRK